MAEKKDKVFVMRMSDAIKSALAELAQGDGISMAGYIEKAIERDLRKREKKTVKKEIVL